MFEILAPNKEVINVKNDDLLPIGRGSYGVTNKKCSRKQIIFQYKKDKDALFLKVVKNQKK